MGCFLFHPVSALAIPDDKQMFEAETAEFIGGAIKVADDQASGRYLVSLTKAGDGIILATLFRIHTTKKAADISIFPRSNNPF